MPHDKKGSHSNGDRPPTQGRITGRLQREYRYYRALIEDPRTPTPAKWLIGGGVGYLLLPIDLIPDFIPVVGKLDDMLIAPALIGLGMRLVPEGVKAEDRRRSRRVRLLYDDQSMGPVLFQSEALPGPFGVRVGTGGRDANTQGPVLFPLLDLMFEYGLVVVSDTRPSVDRFDAYTLHNAKNGEPGRCREQVQLDINFRPLPLVAAVIYRDSENNETDRFVNMEAAYTALPPDLKRRIQELRLRWQPCAEIQLDAVLKSDDALSKPSDFAHVVSGAQFLSLMLDEQCHIVDVSETFSGQLLSLIRQHVLNDVFCYTHPPLDGDLITWNPRKILRMPLDDSSTTTAQYIYPRQLDGTLLGH